MDKALELASNALRAGEVPVGAVLVLNSQIIAGFGNEIEQRNDPTAHAELLVLQEGCRQLETPRLVDCDLYVTLEPCPMCAQAVSFARIKRLYFGAYDPKGGGVDHGPRIFEQTTCHHRPEVIGGVRELECSRLLKHFFEDLRSNS